MKKRTRMVAIILILALVVTAVPTGIALMGAGSGITSQQREDAMAEASQFSAASWMSAVDDQMKLTSVNIPGTHDSATAHITPGYFLQCQKLGISDQLYAGFRYLDIRLAVDEDKEGNVSLKFIHAFGNCRKTGAPSSGTLHLDDVLSDVYAFLDANPSETVIFVVKDEGGEDDPAAFETAFFSYLDQKPDKWYTANTIPTIGEVRGRIVLATRFDDVNGEGEDRMGLITHWSQQENKEVIDDPQEVVPINEGEMLYVQDRFKYGVQDKWAAFAQSMNESMAGDIVLSLNFLSTSGSGSAGHPKSYANTLNAQLLNTNLETGRCYGVIIVDFGEEALARHIFASNIY
ncbi:MAG: hypothetical protein K6B14_12205 [Lachnospiraceae bacterium]|nr:hypothetical protein [Lachnospiraceae bacterium]